MVDEPEYGAYPMPMTSTYKHAVEVGRIRYNLIYGCLLYTSPSPRDS